MINYSIIIPHKNSPEMLRKCLSSIPDRSDVQVIVVDDNSSPEIVDFNDFPGQGASRTTVVLTKEGRGAGYARNIGLKHAEGKWIIFIDADDYFLDGIDKAMDEYADSGADLIFFKNVAVKIPSGERSVRGDELNYRVEKALESGDFTLPVLYSSPWQKFFKRRMIEENGIRFNEVRWGNDVVFMGRVAAAAKKIVACDLPIYCLTESDNSIIKTVSLESRIVRFRQECENVGILRKTRYGDEDSIYYWHFRTWLDMWKINKFQAAIRIPQAIYFGRGRFVQQFIKALSD